MFRTLQSKIAAGYIVILILLIVIAVWSLNIILQLSQGMNQLLLRNYNSVISAENMVEALERQNTNHLALFSIEADFIDQQIHRFDADKEIFFDWFQRSSDNLGHEHEQRILDTLRQLYQSYLIDHGDLIKQVRARELRIARQFYLDWVLPKNNLMKEKCFRIFEINQGTMYTANQQAQRSADQTIITIVILAFLTVAFGIWASWKFTSFIVTPIRELTETVMEIGSGNLSRSVRINSRDEVGQLGEEFNRMTERLRHFETLNIDRIITEKKKSVAIVESIADPLVVIDADERIIHANHSSQPLFRLPPADLPGRELRDVIISDRILARIEDLMNAEPASGERTEEVSVIGDMNTIYYRIRSTPIRTEEGHLIGDVIIFQDITHFKEIDRMKSDFVANVSHELRTPLTSIQMAVDLLLAESIAPLDSQQRNLLANSRTDCNRLTRMVQNLLDLSRLESGRFRLNRSTVDIMTLVQDVVSHYRLLIEEKELDVRIPHASTRLIVNVDAEQFRIVVSNLLANAIRYTDEGGRITFTFERRGTEFYFEIRDTGRGIAEEHLPRVFDKFVQVGSETSPGSVGLGLSIVKDIIQAHGGTIGVESTLGSGSTFWCRVPWD